MALAASLLIYVAWPAFLIWAGIALWHTPAMQAWLCGGRVIDLGPRGVPMDYGMAASLALVAWLVYLGMIAVYVMLVPIIRGHWHA